MAFFGKDTTPRSIEIDPTTITSDSDAVRSRLDRIGANYERLAEILADLETRIETDERLRAINDSIDDATVESAAAEKASKRKWRARKKTSKPTRKKNAGPNKPR
jgi:predicted kinase